MSFWISLSRLSSFVIVFIVPFLLSSAVFAQITTYTADFQNISIQAAVPGWVDSDGNGARIERVFRAWPDPLQPANTVYGIRQMRRRAVAEPPAGSDARHGVFSTYAAQSFDAMALNYTGRVLVTDAQSQFGLTLLSNGARSYVIGWHDGMIDVQALGGGTLAGVTETNIAVEPNRWYDFRVEADDSSGVTAIRARIWQDGSAEPQAFSINAADGDPQRLTSGNIGLWSGGGDFFVDDLSVTAGRTATSAVTFIDAATSQTLDPSAVAFFATTPRIRVLADAEASITLDGAPYTQESPIAGDGAHTIVVHTTGGDTSLRILIDTTPPEVRLSSPARGACTSAAAVAVAGRAIDLTLTGVKVVIGALPAVDATVASDGTFAASIPVDAQGVFDVGVEATDRAGHRSTLHLPITIDRDKPSIEISSAGAVFNGGVFNHPLALFVRAIDADAASAVTITVNDQPYAPGTLISNDGAYSVRAMASDCAGNVSEPRLAQFAIDTVAPRLVSVDPADGGSVGAQQISIRGTADAGDLKSVAIEGSPATASINGRDFVFSSVALSEG
ncbi:MAG TPA: hypothetical protein VL284_00220, partial [Thermoanaerobaculia bacterium]|nr:hypothetical protein [Thermoanaerobaculia bacterium]